MEFVITKVRRRGQAAADLSFWRSRPVSERLAAVEVLRQQAFGSKTADDAEPRLQRVCRVVQRARG